MVNHLCFDQLTSLEMLGGDDWGGGGGGGVTVNSVFNVLQQHKPIPCKGGHLGISNEDRLVALRLSSCVTLYSSTGWPGNALLLCRVRRA